MRALHLTLVLGVLVACSPAIPDSGAGIGFDNSIDRQREREAALANGGTINGDPLIPPAAVSSETLGPVPSMASTGQPLPPPDAGQPVTANSGQMLSASPTHNGNADDIARETAAALALASANSGVEPVQASPSNPAPQTYSNPGISDENDFAAVSGRETIASDAERIAQNRQQYQQIAPTAVPTRTGDASPNIVGYALGTSNPVGARVFSRTGFNLQAKAARNCARYPSADQAQIDFLAGGGPQRDRLGLDPDGDGFACSWDPGPFRQAARN